MILDEPTAFLDVPRRVEIMSLLHHLANDTGTAILLSTHDLELALRTADRIWLMSADGQLDVGAPEDLVLSGAVERIFTNERVTFDPEHGAFLIAKPQHQRVTLRGDGVAGLWTRRALERAGFQVASEARNVGLHVQVVKHEDGIAWNVRIGERNILYETIYSMIKALQHEVLSETNEHVRSAC
jgi:iron complex transport system ATP-binding protein